jgi:hypothetical protein
LTGVIYIFYVRQSVYQRGLAARGSWRGESSDFLKPDNTRPGLDMGRELYKNNYPKMTRGIGILYTRIITPNCLLASSYIHYQSTG